VDALSKELLTKILSLPTMSFHETAVATFVRWYAAGLGLSVREDRAGNLLVEYRGARAPSVTFTAHMDHPGFEVISSRGNRAIIAQWGKVDLAMFAGSKVIVHTSAGPARGTIAQRSLAKKHLGRPTCALAVDAPVARGDFGAFDLPPPAIARGQIHALAIDNLASVALILDLLTRFAKGRAQVSIAALFTRGEEAGFLGAFAAMESGIIPKTTPLVVLECSSAAGGGVAIGDGPVVRAGDLASTYDPAVEVWISDVAASLVASHESRVTSHGFHFQRALLQGGRCEACVYVAEGYKVGGIALPLGNYHNHGPKRKPAAEYVSVADYDHELTLLAALAHRPMPRDPLRAKALPIWKHYRGLKKKLIASA
jgi:putative aminopeptidase FrvX